MKRILIAANWKMNTNFLEASQIVSSLKLLMGNSDGVETIICPPFVYLQEISSQMRGTGVGIGAQNIHFEDKGAFTGETSPSMVADYCQFVIIGHSERRQFFGDTDNVVNKKVISAIGHNLSPILCVGEHLEDREKGNAELVVGRQLEEALKGVPASDGLIVAYEPVWAIGTGKSATPEVAEEIISYIRCSLANIYDESLAAKIPLLYGGSVTAENVLDYVVKPNINGALVGGASLDAQKFNDIIVCASKAV